MIFNVALGFFDRGGLLGNGPQEGLPFVLFIGEAF